jgi:hypothetical protein
MAFWYQFGAAGAFMAGIESGVFDPWAEREEGSVYSAATVLPAELRAWLDRPGETIAAKPHPGGRPKKFDWDLIWALTCRDLIENDLPRSIAELIRRTQAACREAGIAEPNELTLRPKARVWIDILWRGDRPEPTPQQGSRSKINSASAKGIH